MKLAVRDDDTCFYTSPSTLREVYEEFWDDIPITLACVPNVAADADVVIDIEDTETNRKITENRSLVEFIQHQIKCGRFEVALHGYHHNTPNDKPEYVSGGKLKEKTAHGVEILSDGFDIEIDVFVPPHVRLSNRGLKAIAHEGLNVARGRGPRPRELQMSPQWITTYGQLLSFYLQKGRQYRYPFPLDYGTHQEVYCHRINENSNMKEIKKSFDYVYKNDGVFCVSAHAAALSKEGRKKLRQVLRYAIDHEVEPVSIRELLNTSQSSMQLKSFITGK
ncbi:DUF2334 domain-containing protein [Natronomonas marina]|uniref:DUF2334 domain-containing protein n=1 Tax=Natronomonas marina TaxID=2961939 RepID=UPI0020C96DEA|nr:DUF2334 domain-containing protein [Natronomonas marina]